MAIFKKLLAATALFNVALSGTAYSSDVESVVTSIQLVTSVTFINPSATSSSTHCNTLTVTEIAPPNTMTVVAPPPVSGTGAETSAKSTKDWTVQTSITSSIPSKPFPTEICVSSVHTVTVGTQVQTLTGCHMPPGLAPPTPTLTKSLTSTKSLRETVVLSPSGATETAIKPTEGIPHRPSVKPSHSFHVNGTMTATATGTGAASASASWTRPVLPPFTDAADASNVGAALLLGGVMMAVFGA